MVCRGKNGTPKLGSSGTMDPPELISLQDFAPPLPRKFGPPPANDLVKSELYVTAKFGSLR